MAETDADFKTRVHALVTKLRAAQAQEYAVTEELLRLLENNKTVSEEARRLFGTWGTAWGRHYGDKYAFSGAKDMANFKRLLKTFTVDEIERRMLVYLQDADPFYVRGRHPLGVFVASFNKHGVSVAGADFTLEAPVIAGCKHAPRCTSDQQHTKLTQHDIRRGA